MGQARTQLAWAGWRTRMPADWRPLRIAGTWRQGHLVLGNTEQSLLQLDWQRPPARRFDAAVWTDRWIAARRKAAPDCDPVVASPAGFSSGARIPPNQAVPAARDESGCPVWCAYSADARLVLECRLNAGLPDTLRKTIHRVLLEHMRPVKPADPVPWAVFETYFESPPGFVYEKSQLNAGDIGLRFSAAGGRRLTVRQVYPAELALGHQPLEQWVGSPLFPDRRPLKRVGESQRRSIALRSGVTGELLVLRSRRTLPPPLSRLGSRHAVAAGVQDPQAGRLLIAREEGRRPLSDACCVSAVQAMGACREET